MATSLSRSESRRRRPLSRGLSRGLSRSALAERLGGPAIRTVLRLPAPALRLLAGRPVIVDGQRLDVEVQVALRLIRASGLPAAESAPVERGRVILSRQARMVGTGRAIGAVRDLQVPGAAGALAARLYVPQALLGAATAPLLVFFHGGGWIYGDLDSHDGACRALAEEAGVRVLSVGYRLAPEAGFPAAYDDCLAAYTHIVSHAESYGAAPERIGVGGDSAGGALAAATAIEAARRGLPCRFQLLIYPATDMAGTSRSRELFGAGFYLTTEFMELARANYLPVAEDLTDPRASVLFADLPAGLAPAYLCTAGFDPLRDEGEAYAEKLRQAGVPVELRRFEAQIHGFLNWVGAGRSGPAAVSEVAARLRAGLVE